MRAARVRFRCDPEDAHRAGRERAKDLALGLRASGRGRQLGRPILRSMFFPCQVVVANHSVLSSFLFLSIRAAKPRADTGEAARLLAERGDLEHRERRRGRQTQRQSAHRLRRGTLRQHQCCPCSNCLRLTLDCISLLHCRHCFQAPCTSQSTSRRFEHHTLCTHNNLGSQHPPASYRRVITCVK